ncbi:nitroreductase family protein [Maridesulfovibrio hydrothermalis]|uniref:Nitroreductase n=1 Tax=Maridesulfovibrio hydrothermalis AM13 = DSM 14728 TaxID=1121451 RepID=L0R6K9_9BACT|nr:nitroreductase [Maridesulfovibrio hydrothermalis]CCO22343.1 Nitroreductase [Maridesulfovibrio hydrothermalis AM13 = DSM 14728]
MNSGNPVLEALINRRSIRKFTDEPVSREDITAILEAGRWAPSGRNNQPWRFMVIHQDDHRAAKLSECTKYGHIVKEAKVLFCILLERESIYNKMKDHQGTGGCIQNMMLAAHSLGIGTVWLGEILNQEKQVLDILGLSADKYELQVVIAAGHPDQKGSSKRKELSELMLEDY